MRTLLRLLSVLALAMISLSAVAQVTTATLPVGSYPDVVAVNTATNQIYTVNAQCYTFSCSTQGTVTVTDGVTHNIVGTVNVGYSPADTIVNPTTNKIYVANLCGNDATCQSPGTVTVIDGATLQTATVTVGYAPGFSLHGIAINQTTNTIYVANECLGSGWPSCPPGSGTVTVINGSTLATQSVTAGRTPINLAVNSQTNMIYVANSGTPGGSNSTVTVINGSTLATQTVNTGYITEDVQLDATTDQIYASNVCGNDTSCQSGTVTVIDGATLTTQTIAAGYQPFWLAVNPVTNTIYTANACADSSCSTPPTITAINGTTLSTTAVPVCKAAESPGDVEVNTVTNKIYTPCEDFTKGNPPGQTVFVIDGATNTTFPIAVGDQPNSSTINSVTNTIYTPNLLDNTISVIGGDTKLQLVNVTPCRLVDTRKSGGPIPGGTSESFTLPQLGGCNIPTTAAAYSLNVTVVPSGQLGYLTIWPTGEFQPVVSTMNSPDGRIKANAAIVQAGVNGAVSVYVSNTTNVVLDIDAYFAPSGQTLEFYPLTPCRVLDTRNANGPLGGPYLTTKQERDFPVLSSDCNIPSSAQAYSMNFTVVPYQGQSLGYLTVWGQGGSQPVVSTLNNLTATIVANAAIVPAGTAGGIAVYPSGNTQLVGDIDGYFAPAGTGGLSLYPTAPCRVVDTRKAGGAFSGELTVNVVGSPCNPPSSALGYVFNATVVPVGGLGYLTLWPDTEQQPKVSTLNAIDGAITSNMAIVPNINGKTDAYASGITQLILDISSFFAP
jgi:DNA-binding beta-propeller fold protein YncE